MAIVQEAFDIPDDIMTKIFTGEYRRTGGVVRYAGGPNKGQIVKHLHPVDLKAKEPVQDIGAKVLQFVKNNKKALIIIGISTGIVFAGASVYYKIKRREPEIVVKFRFALKAYINAIRNGNLDIGTIDDLMIALAELKNYKDYEKISIQLSTEELEVLVNKIYEYTLKLAKDNSIELTDEEIVKSYISRNAIVKLQKYLYMQKRIFETVA